jgi:hypothetical protein
MLSEGGKISNASAAPDGCYHLKMLTVSRVRDASTGKERIAVELFDKLDDKAPYAKVYCNPLSLHDDIIKLREYGVISPRKETLRMADTIEKNYYNFNCAIDAGVRTLESEIDSIIRFICKYIRDNDIKVKTIGSNELYCIPVNDFRKLFKNSDYACYRLTDVRRLLHDLECTVCSPRRYDYTIKTNGNGEPIKVIALCANSTDIIDAMNEPDNDCAEE